MPFIGRVKNRHCTGYSLLFPIRRYAGLKRTSIAVDRLPAVNLLADNCRQSPIRRDESASDYLNIQQPPVKRPSCCLCQKAVPTGPTWFSARPPAGGETASAHHPVTSAPQATVRHPKVPTSGSSSSLRISCNGWPPRELIPAAVSAGNWDWVEAIWHLPVSVRPSAGSQAGRSCQAAPRSGCRARTDPPPGCTTRVRLRTT